MPDNRSFIPCGRLTGLAECPGQIDPATIQVDTIQFGRASSSTAGRVGDQLITLDVQCPVCHKKWTTGVQLGDLTELEPEET